MRVSEIPHVEHGRIAVCSCQTAFRIDESTVVEEYSLPDLPPPEFIGRYRIERYVGRGASNCVYEGVNPETGVRAAIKTLLPEYAGDKPSREQFFHAAKICAKAVHPNIVNVYEIGRDANGVPFLAMEYLSGGTLADLLQNNRAFTAREAAETGAAVCRALAVTSELGLVHRDIKPDNIMISADGQYKLTDLGLAKLNSPYASGNEARVLDEKGDRSTRKTSFGTLEYMSPEQYVDADSCDIRSDIYSLGVTLYQLAAGRLPFEPKSRSELRHMHLSVEPIVPSTHKPDIPLDFDYIVLHCIQKRPEDRYQTPAELLDDLNAFLAGKPLPSTTGGAVPVIHAPQEVFPAATTPSAPNRLRFLPALAGTLVLLILGIGALLLLKRTDGNRIAPDAPPPPARDAVPESLGADIGAPVPGAPANGGIVPGSLARPSSKALDDAGITIVDQETDSQVQSYFEDARNAADQALRDKAGFRKAIEDLKSFASTDKYSVESKVIISKLEAASADAVRELMDKLDRKAAPLIEAREWEGAINVYRIDVGPLAPESQEARERKIREIEQKRQEAASVPAPGEEGSPQP